MSDMHGNSWIGGDTDGGSLVKVEVRVERTDRDEVALFTSADDVETASLYLSRATARRVAVALRRAAEGNEVK